MCVQTSDPAYEGSGACASPQNFNDFLEPQKQAWEDSCGQHWAQTCHVDTEFTVHGLEDTTEYYFIITAVNMGGAGAVNAPYHAAVDPYDRWSARYGGIYPPGSGDAAEGVPPGAPYNTPAGSGRPYNYGDYPSNGKPSAYPETTGAGFVRKRSAHLVYQGESADSGDGRGMKQFYGEGDFSDSSQVVFAYLFVGARVWAQDRLLQLPEMPGRYRTNMPFFNPRLVAKYPGVPTTNPGGEPTFATSSAFGATTSADTCDGKASDGSLGTWDGTEADCEGHFLLVRLSYVVDDIHGHSRKTTNTWYYPAKISADNHDGTFAVVFDEVDATEDALEDLALPRTMIDTLAQGSNRPAAVTWRVPDAPAAPTFGTITENSIEVFWKPPPFDGNTNHEVQYADPTDTSSGGIVTGYRLFMQRYDDTTGIREEWIELDVAYLGTNSTHVVTNLDADVTYTFTVIAINIVGDSAHSQEAEAPITLEDPIPKQTVAITMRPICPEMQPRQAKPADQWLTCTNIPSTLLATTSGGGTNAVFNWTLYQEFVEVVTIPPVWTQEDMGAV